MGVRKTHGVGVQEKLDVIGQDREQVGDAKEAKGPAIELRPRVGVANNLRSGV